MNTKRPPLSERIGDAAYHLEQTKEGPTLAMLDSWDAHASEMEDLARKDAEEIANLKAARAKDQELIQMAVDMVHEYVEGWVDERWREVVCEKELAFLRQAAAQGFKPSDE